MLITSLPNALQQAEQHSQDQLHGQHDLLSGHAPSEPHYVEATPWDEKTRLQGEKETLGFYLTGHPLNRYLNELVNFTTCRISELSPAQHPNACIAGIITNIRTRQTKRGDRIAIFALDDGTGQIEVVCFSEPYQKYRALLNEDELVVISGEVGIDEFSHSARITGREVFTFDQARERFAKYLQIQLSTAKSFDTSSLKQVLDSHLGGNCPIVIRFLRDDIQTNIQLGKKWLVKPTEALIDLMQRELPVESVEVVY